VPRFDSNFSFCQIYRVVYFKGLAKTYPLIWISDMLLKEKVLKKGGQKLPPLLDFYNF